MDYTYGILAIVVGVAFSVALHEVGHLVPAKRFGVKCSQYMVGFGPTLWSMRRGETEYGIKAIPLGGYVRMLGMFPPNADGTIRADSTGRWSLLIEQARSDAAREVGPQDADRLFYQRSVPKRLVIMLGGPVMNLVIAVVLLTVIVTGFGLPTATTRVSSVSKCVIPADAAASATCGSQYPAAPAAKAGLLPGDVIVAFGGKAVSTWDDVRAAIRANGDHTVTLTVLRSGSRVALPVTPIIDQRPVLNANGEPVVGKDGKTVLEAVGFLGVSPSAELVRQSVTVVPGLLASGLKQTAGVILRIPQKMVGVAQAAFGNGARDPNGPVSLLGVSRFAGEVASAKGTAAMPLTFGDRVAQMLSLITSLNLALFVFNLVPLLPLDGGHVAGAVWEGFRRRFARLRNRPDPGPVDVARALPLAYGVASMLLGMSVLLMYADIVRPIKLGG